MAIVRLTCPECDKVFKASAEPAPGKKVRCPACKHAFVPAPEEDDDETDDEEEPRGKAKTPARKAKNDAPPKKSRRDEDEDDDDDDEDSEDEEVPAKKKKKKKQAGAGAVLYWVYRGVSVLVLLVLLGVLAWIVFLRTPPLPKLNDESVMQVAPGVTRSRTIDAIANSQKINVSATAITGQFNIYVFLEKDQAEVDKGITFGKMSPKVLAHQLKATQADLSATILPNERAAVMVDSGDGKKAEVKLKITN